MRNSISKTIVAGLAALAMATAVILPTTPASAGWSGGALGMAAAGEAAGMAGAGATAGTAPGIRAIGAAASGTTAGGARR